MWRKTSSKKYSRFDRVFVFVFVGGGVLIAKERKYSIPLVLFCSLLSSTTYCYKINLYLIKKLRSGQVYDANLT